VSRSPADRSHLSIGEVLSLLQDEFPDVTISKIRFLESQGLLDPERTPSGYRKFYDGDIDRLRWILRQQKEHYLPLKVIKDRLDDREGQGALPLSAPEGGAAGGSGAAYGDDRAATGAASRNGAARAGLAVDERPDTPEVGEPPEAPAEPPAERARWAGEPASAPGQWPGVPAEPGDWADVPVTEARQWAGAPASDPVTPRPTPGSETVAGRSAPVSPGPRSADEVTGGASAPRTRAPGGGPAGGEAPEGRAGVSLTIDELAEASGMQVRDLRELEQFGLLESHVVGDAAYYDGDALVVARTAGGFLRHGIEARHLRSYKVAVDREAGLFEQIVLPLLKQRNPQAHRRASQIMAELIQLGEAMRGTLLRRELRDHID
jgi:DNA-binding transcriptional MerR regulator